MPLPVDAVAGDAERLVLRGAGVVWCHAGGHLANVIGYVTHAALAQGRGPAHHHRLSDGERTALVRHCVRMFNAGANLTTPLFGVVVRKAYGLGVQAMCGASSLVGFFTVAWPTAEFAGMNIEGSVKLGYRKKLAAIEDAEERRLEFERRVAYEGAKAINAGVGGGLDDVIDPAETRSWIASSLKRLPPKQPRTEKKYPYIDRW